MYTLCIDYREKGIIELFVRKFDISPIVGDVSPIQLNGDVFRVKVQNLPLADFVYQDDQENDLLMIERKTKGDLISSVIDGRFREQKSRLQQYQKDVIYLIESPGQVIKRGEKTNNHIQTMYYSSLLNMQFKNNFKVFVSLNMEETVDVLTLLLKKIKNKDFACNSDMGIQPTEVRPKARAENVHDNLFAYQLSLIQGVSITIASKIAEQYKSPLELCKEYMGKPEKEGELLLSEVKVTDKRKVGKALSKKIYWCFSGSYV
jgi:ERCC4-type nuclease